MKAYESITGKEKHSSSFQHAPKPVPAIQCKGYEARTSYPLPAIQPKPNHTGLPDQLKAGVEAFSGYSMDDVKVHYNSDKPAQLQALAYAQGTDIHVAPGQEAHMPHEAWHVVQQKQGRVKPTVQMKGGVHVNDDKVLEQEADIIGTKALNAPAFYQDKAFQHDQEVLDKNSLDKQNNPDAALPQQEYNPGGWNNQYLPPSSVQLKSGKSATSGIIQRKGIAPLMGQLRPLLVWAMGQVGGALNYDINFKSLFKKINDYDRSTDGRPSVHLAAVESMMQDLDNWFASKVDQLSSKDIQNYAQLKLILSEERDTNKKQTTRLNKYTADVTSPYEQMTDEGILWTHPDFEHNTEKMKLKGKAYFDELSRKNIESMIEEKKGLTDTDWFDSFVDEASSALSDAVVNHYTTTARAQLMLDNGMKSKVMLEKEVAAFKHNTSAYDDFGLANSGFLYFFIESPKAPFRDTRFAEGDSGAKPARISIPIKDSGLLENGWLMLSDFAQREYPDIMTTEKNEKHTSWLPTRAQEQKSKKPEFNQLVKQFEPGLAPFEEHHMEKMEKIKDQDIRQAFSAVTPQVLGDKTSKQKYYSSKGKSIEVPDRLFNNLLVGKDIIPGLAFRAGLEVARISEVNPGLGENLQKLKGDNLLLFILKDLFRPQAMIPNSLKLKKENVQTK